MRYQSYLIDKTMEEQRKFTTYFKNYFVTDLVVIAVIFGLFVVSNKVFAQDNTGRPSGRRIFQYLDKNDDSVLNKRKNTT